MQLAQRVSSLVLSLRKKEQIKVRQPLARVLIPAMNEEFRRRLSEVESLILSEVNVKKLELLTEDSEMLVKQAKPNFKVLGKRFGSKMKTVSGIIAGFSQEDIRRMESDGRFEIEIEGEQYTLTSEDLEISTRDIPGWLVANDGDVTVALDITITENLRYEGFARELVNRIQNLRKESGLEVTDRIRLEVQHHPGITPAIEKNLEYICAETLAGSLEVVDKVSSNAALDAELEEGFTTRIALVKIN
jgi:isoleucyl-tRNA synthetase